MTDHPNLKPEDRALIESEQLISVGLWELRKVRRILGPSDAHPETRVVDAQDALDAIIAREDGRRAPGDLEAAARRLLACCEQPRGGLSRQGGEERAAMDGLRAILERRAPGEGTQVGRDEAALPEAAAAKLVGREPTDAMYAAARGYLKLDGDTNLRAAWTSMFDAAPPPPPVTEVAGSFQKRVQPWMMACFGAEIAADRLERNDRFIEEALELVQASDYPAERVHALVEYVYGRPQGDINQEVGGVMVTLAAHCLAHGVDMHAAGETELARIWTKVEQIRAKQAAKPKGSALPIADRVPSEAEEGKKQDCIPERLTDQCADAGPLPALATVIDTATGAEVPGQITRDVIQSMKLHHRTAALVNTFAWALAEKLAKAEQKYGYSDGWANDDWEDECRANFMEHIQKGDPRDVAAYCAFMWRNGWSTTPKKQVPSLFPDLGTSTTYYAVREAVRLADKQLDTLRAALGFRTLDGGEAVHTGQLRDEPVSSSPAEQGGE